MIYLYPGVYSGEVNLSNLVQTIANSFGAVVINSPQGPLTPQYVTNNKAFISTYGKPNINVYGPSMYCALDFLNMSSSLWVLRAVNGSTFPQLTYSPTSSAGIFLPAASGVALPSEMVSFPSGAPFAVFPVGPGSYSNNQIAIAITSVNVPNNTFNLAVYVGGQTNVAAETWTVSLNYQLDGYGAQQFIELAINGQSKYIQAFVDPANLPFDISNINTVAPTYFINGSDGSTLTDAQIINAYNVFADQTSYTLNMLINAGWSDPAVQAAIINIAENRGDCTGILDMPSSDQATVDALNYRNVTLNANTSYAAIYSGDELSYDTYTAANQYIPPSGKVGGQYAYNDFVAQPWFSPAGYKRGLLPNTVGLRVPYQDADMRLLYPAQVNCIISDPGNGYLIYGDKTLQAMPSSLQYINVRRLLIVLEKSIATSVKYFMFDPNDPTTWIIITEMCTRFLQSVLNARGLYAFEVVCNSTNNTPQNTQQGLLNLDLFIQPTRSIEFIQVTSVITATGSSFSEAIKAIGA